MVEGKVYSRQSENKGRCKNIWENPKFTRPEWTGTYGEKEGGERGEPDAAAGRVNLQKWQDCIGKSHWVKGSPAHGLGSSR